MRFVFLGPPGVGKGTQAEKTSLAENIPHISSGDLLRKAVEKETEIGLNAKEYIEKGVLVPDELVVEIVENEISTGSCRNGFILDGFPRNLPQAKILDSTLSRLGKEIDKVFCFTALEGVLIKRISGRRVCKSCGAYYHETFRPPEKSMICDKCGKELHQRKDDKPETISVRLKVYREQTEELIDYYRKCDKLIELDSNGSVTEIQEMLCKELSLLSSG